MRRSSGTQSAIRSSPPVTPASAMNDAISMWSGETRCSQPPSFASAVHVHHVGADPLDRRAHAGQQPREVLHVRLRRRVADDGRAGRERRRHQRVLRAHHGRLVHEEVARLQAAVGRAQADVARVLDVRAERAERVEVRIEPAAADHVAAGRRQQRLAEAGEQRPGDQERGADPLGQGGVDVGLASPRRPAGRRCCRRAARPSRRGPRAAPSSPRCRGSAARCAARPAPP